MRIAITGGGGYVGSRLVPYLLRKGHKVTVLDTFWYGDHLGKHPCLSKITGDIRRKKDLDMAFKDQDAVIHLACVSNDPSFDMNPTLGADINYNCFKSILAAMKSHNVLRFIYASSSSVYGVSELEDVTEDAPKNPLTDYSKYKLMCELELQTFGMGGFWSIIRPATVCGYCPRMRLDLVVNILTIQALVNKKITLFGLNQRRPNINIDDMVLAYEFVLEKEPKYVDQKIFNVGFENLQLIEIAHLVKNTIGDPKIEIVEQPTNDPRSYHINSDAIKELGFKPLFGIKSAIRSIKHAYEEGLFVDPMNNSMYRNIARMKELPL